MINNPATSAYGLRCLQSAEAAGAALGIDVVALVSATQPNSRLFLLGSPKAQTGLVVTPDLFTNTSGASPAEVPVGGPTDFVLTLNLAAARAQGINIPPTCWRRRRR